MNFKCLICSDPFIPGAEIYSTHCGHLFHYVCLIEWLERSRTCPQCRARVTDKTIHKIYLSIDESADSTDAATLLFKLENAQFQLKLKNKDVENLKAKCSDTSMQNEGLRSEVKSLENETRKIKSALDASMEKLSYFKSRSKNYDKLTDEIIKLKEELQNMEDVRTVISGTAAEVDHVLRNNNDAKSLSVLVTSLKKELLNANTRTRQSQHLLQRTKDELRESRRTVANLTKQNMKFEQEIGALKECDKQQVSLQHRIEDPQTSPSINCSSDNEGTKSHSLSQQIKEIQESDSPYLRIKSSSVGLIDLIHRKNSKSTFSLKLPGAAKPLPNDMCYDGLGGHSRVEKFPTANQSNIQGAKRSKPSTITSAKFRKLAPYQRTLSFDKT